LFKVIVVADDFTGANDTGVQLTKQGHSTITILDKHAIKSYENTLDAIVIDTETRTALPKEVYQEIEEVSQLIKPYKDAIIYKKVDSTLRGHIAVELKAMRDVLQPKLIVFAPAFPNNGRTTHRGIHMLNGTPVAKTELAKDPKNPVLTSELKSLLEKDMGVTVRHITLDEIRSDEFNMKLQSVVPSHDVLAFDAVEDDDLVRICTTVLRQNKKVLWVGSAGLADVLINTWQKEIIATLPVLTVAGSVTEVTRKQIHKALEDPQVKLVTIGGEKVLSNPKKEVERVVNESLQFMNQKYDVIIASAPQEHSVEDAVGQGYINNLTAEEVSERIAEVMGETTASIASAQNLAGMILTGGDTAVHVVKQLFADGCKINAELEMGIPLATLIGGPFAGLTVITKAGGFGNQESILNSIKFLRK